MKLPNREQIERLRREYPVGCKVILRKMSDPQSPPLGTEGEVYGVDSSGSLLVHWNNGSSLNVLYGVDVAERVV